MTGYCCPMYVLSNVRARKSTILKISSNLSISTAAETYQIDFSLLLMPFMGCFLIVDETLHDHSLLLECVIAKIKKKVKSALAKNLFPGI